MPIWTYYVLGTALCWGAYGPAIHEGQQYLGSPWKAFFLVGAAYFFIAIVLPTIMIMRSDTTNFQFFAGEGVSKGTSFALAAGALGALGACFITFAMGAGGKPFVVMPLVFGCAPAVNILVSWFLHPPKEQPSPYLWVGFVVLITGAAMVLANKPK